MDLIDFSNGAAWAIKEASLQTMIDRLPEALASKDALSIAQVREDKTGYRVVNGVAVISVSGPLSRRGGIISWIFGGSSFDELSVQFAAALKDPEVEAVVLDIDSPGGTVSGTVGFADMVYDARGLKPVVAFAGGMMTSAAYWVGSAADYIVVSPTSDVGNIGVMMIHYDFSKADERAGLKRTILKSGQYKAIGNDTEPLSDLAVDTFGAELAYVHDLFVSMAAVRNRGLSSDGLGDIAEGKNYIGQLAVDAGLSDAVGTFEAAIEKARSMIQKNAFNVKKLTLKKGAKKMAKELEKLTIETVADMEAACPNLVKEVRESAVAAIDVPGQIDVAVKAESCRILGLAMSIFGEDQGAAFKDAVESGVTVEQYQAISKLLPKPAETPATSDDEAAAQAAMLEAIKVAGPANPGVGGKVEPTEAQDYMALVDQYQAQKKCKRSEALAAVANQCPSAHARYLEGLRPQGNA